MITTSGYIILFNYSSSLFSFIEFNRIKDLCTGNYLWYTYQRIVNVSDLFFYLRISSLFKNLTMIKFLCESRLLGKETETERLEILKQILPDTYKYLVSEFSIKERSQIVGETKFNVTFRVNIMNKEDIQVFFQNLGEKSGTTYNTFCGDTCGTGKKVNTRFSEMPTSCE